MSLDISTLDDVIKDNYGKNNDCAQTDFKNLCLPLVTETDSHTLITHYWLSHVTLSSLFGYSNKGGQCFDSATVFKLTFFLKGNSSKNLFYLTSFNRQSYIHTCR